MISTSYANLAKAFRVYAAKDDATLFEDTGLTRYRGGPEVSADALRLSLALHDCGVPLAGEVAITEGDAAGRRVLLNPARLAEWLSSRWGDGEVIEHDRAAGGAPSALRGRRGVAAFMRGSNAPGGHIALVEPQTLWQTGPASSGFVTDQVRFWALA